MFALDIKIVLIYYKFGERVTPKKAKKLAHQLIADNNDDEKIERLKWQRRDQNYRKLADLQIQELLRTILALKVHTSGTI